MVGESVKSDDLTVCLSALLLEDECVTKALEGSSLPMRRERVGHSKGALTSLII